MKNRTINIAVVEEVALAMGPLNAKMVFVGGAVVSLYADDPIADEIRPTSDIDMTVNLVKFSGWVELQEQLAALHIYPDPYGHSTCSYRYQNIPLDIIPADGPHMGASNRWYGYGFKDLYTVMANTVEIRILPTPCYLASKFEAFNDRGKDYRTSHDFEDIIYVLDNRLSIVDEVASAHLDVKNYLKQELLKAYKGGFWEDILLSHIHPLLLEERAPLLSDKVNQIIQF